jgi:hypothetical protein
VLRQFGIEDAPAPKLERWRTIAHRSTTRRARCTSPWSANTPASRTPISR